MTYEEQKVWGILQWHRGKARAITYAKLAKAAGISPRSARETVNHLVVGHRKPICSSYDRTNGGYYIPAIHEELEENIRQLGKHALAILHRRSILRRAVLPRYTGQLRLELGE